MGFDTPTWAGGPINKVTFLTQHSVLHLTDLYTNASPPLARGQGEASRLRLARGQGKLPGVTKLTTSNMTTCLGRGGVYHRYIPAPEVVDQRSIHLSDNYVVAVLGPQAILKYSLSSFSLLIMEVNPTD